MSHNTLKMYEKEYYHNGIVQHDAAIELGSLLPASPASVLDIGCGSGKVSELFYSKMKPTKMIAIDKSNNMIDEAISLHKRTNIDYKTYDIEEMELKLKFDVIISNSSLQWFEDINKSLKVIRNHMSNNGLFFVQTPFKKDWCPAITKMINDFFDHAYPDLKNEFNFPCRHLDNAEEYKKLFESSELFIKHSYNKEFTYHVDIHDFMKIFKSGAIKAYSNQSNFKMELPTNFRNDLIKFAQNYYDSNEMIKLTMPRIFFILQRSKI
ncbi:methyltransferase domain-containing protein [Vibrio parahaemolyticus]|uniref:methyltransferase domain-containing protein n=1 Tax=Vibrio parahaemolyticus TaxID=670 RepID=UPI0004E1E130|nr:methyltransferase domain-containing protein [Vibrio parahaemolyticus]MDF4866472.1 methyltransferase domain-containing protein [Vibrio parahaemolyticus]MDG2809991.1 methyltransferase domain-containing protein [Vibrio parahaemolyticus]MRE06957.1 methyltransferase domain-containing protein [Vibrio parahaemolyticus]NKJ89987.1 methyltransferase domain-containing protein [Vibrio parahaemolyticus]TBT60372.1 methyltransferase domain-containing protein [Vibrio parahaemolyticus]